MPRSPEARRRRTILKYVLTALILGVVGYYFWKQLSRNIDALRSVDYSVDGWIVLAILTFAYAVTVSGRLWGAMVSQLSDKRVPPLEAVRVHCSSWLLKYIPGQMGSVVNKVAWASRWDLPKSLVTLTFIYENVFLIIGSMVPTTVILLAMGALDLTGNHTLLIALLALVPIIALTNRRVFRWMTNLVAHRTLKRDIPAEYFLGSGQALKYQLWYMLPRVVNGIGVIAIAHSMFGSPARTWVPIICAYTIAGAVGIMAILVPSGLGVRESVFVFLLGPYLPVEQAIILSLAARLFATLADLVVALVYLVLNTQKSRWTPQATDAPQETQS